MESSVDPAWPTSKFFVKFPWTMSKARTIFLRMMSKGVQKPKVKKERMGYFRLTPAEYQRLEKVASLEAAPVSVIVRRAIREFLSKQVA